MDKTALKTLNSILRRDATDTTYKYALLRALVEIADEAEQHIISKDKNKIVLPLGLIIEKWLFYYYPIVEAGLPQKYGADPSDPTKKKITFRQQLGSIVDQYHGRGGFKAFVIDYKVGRFSGQNSDLVNLLKTLRRTITDYPMKHLGYSAFKRHYGIVQPNKDAKRLTKQILQSPVDSVFLIQNFGTFTLRRDFYELFRAVGGFVTGTDAILYQWALFTASAVKNLDISINKALDVLLISPEVDHNVKAARHLYLKELKQGSKLRCVWSGKGLSKNTLAIDHVIPFSLWGNNDLWNLLPSHQSINLKKKDKIPEPELVLAQRKAIYSYWDAMRDEYPDAFDREFRVSLSGIAISDFDGLYSKVGVQTRIVILKFLY